MRNIRTSIGTLALALSLTVPTLAAEAPSGAPSQEALAKEVVSAMSAKDQKVLEQLQISGEEFKRYVWPTIAYRVSSSQMNAEKFYSISQKSSAAGLQSSLDSLGGKEWQLVSVSPGAEMKAAKDARLFEAPTLTIRSGAGEEKAVKLLGGVLEHNGSFKVTSYFVIPPRQQQ